MVFIFRGFALRFFFCSGLKVSLFVFAGGPGGGFRVGQPKALKQMEPGQVGSLVVGRAKQKAPECPTP